jgi:hypothetical protein
MDFQLMNLPAENTSNDAGQFQEKLVVLLPIVVRGATVRVDICSRERALPLWSEGCPFTFSFSERRSEIASGGEV